MDWSRGDFPLTTQLSSELDPAWVVLPASTAEHQARSRTFTVRCGNKRGARGWETQTPTCPLTQRRNHPGANVLGRGPLTSEVGQGRGSPDQTQRSRWALAGLWQSLGSLWTSRGRWLQQGLWENHKAGPVSFPRSHTPSLCGCDSHSQGHSGHLVRCACPLLPMASPRPPAPWEPLSHPSRCTLARWALSDAEWRKRWRNRLSRAGQEEVPQSDRGRPTQVEGTFLRFPWGYKRNPQNPKRSFQNTVGSLVACGPAQGQGGYWKWGSWWRSPVQVRALEQVPPLGSGEGPPQVLRAPGSRPA